jgi:hypothetical protein
MPPTPSPIVLFVMLCTMVSSLYCWWLWSELFIRLFATAPPKTIVLLYTTEDWSDLACAATHQMLRYRPPHLVRVEAIVHNYSECERTLEFAEDTDVPSGCTERFGSKISYMSILFIRLGDVRRHVDSRKKGVTGYLMLDSDVVLYRNIVARMERAGSDFVFQRELPCHTERGRLCINGGVWWVRAQSKRALAVLDDAIHLMAQLWIPDQDALQHALARSNATVTYLNTRRYPNGFLYNYDRRLKASNVHMVHVNWAPDKQAKLDRLYDLGMVERYAHCFSEETLATLRTRRSNATTLPSGFKLSLTQPPGITRYDLGNALGCSDIGSGYCIDQRVEHRSLPYHLLN